MKVLQIITLGHELYGAQKHVLELSEMLSQDNHEVVVVVGTEGALTEQLKEKSINYILLESLKREINLFYDFKCIYDLTKIYNKFRPDIVATHSSKAGIVGRIAAWLCGIPNTFTAHGWSFEEGIPEPSRTLFFWIEKLVGKISTKVIAVAELEREYALKKKVIEANKIEVVHYGTKDNYISSRKVISISEKVKKFTITMVAGFRPQKDHRTLIEALYELRHLDWCVYFLGDGPLEDEIKEYVKSLGFAEKFHFEGAVSNVDFYLYKTDLMVLSTNWEGLPISIIEGLSFYLPVIATDVAGVKEEVIDGFNGFTFKRGDWNKLKEDILTLFNNIEKREKFSKNSRKLFEEKFTLNMMYSKTLNIYIKCRK